MPSYFPCPNAQCQYQFDADILPAAAMVTCPMCRTKFPYRATPPVGSEPPPAPLTSTGPRVLNVRNVPQRGGILPTILWGAGFSVVLIALLFAVYMWNRQKPFVNKKHNEDRWNFSLDIPDGWEEDAPVRTEMNVNIFVKKKVGAEQWAAMFAKDYGDRSARPAEVRDELLARFKVGQNDPDAPRAFRNLTQVELEDAKWLKQPAIAYEFTAEYNDLPVHGECHAVQYKGIVYAFYVFAANKEWDGCKAELAAFRNRIQLGSAREKWEEKVSNTRTFSPEGAPYQVEDRDDVWRAAVEDGDLKKGDYVVNPKDIDKHATMAFIARHKFRVGRDTRVREGEAKALIVELPKGGDPLETAKAHVIELLKKDYPNPPDLKFDALTKSPGGVAIPSNGPAITRLLMRDPLDKENVNMWIIAAIDIGDKTVAIEINTHERYAAQLEGYMVNLAHSLKAK